MSQPLPDLDLNYPSRLCPQRKDWRIGCVGAGFIMRDCHLVAYRQAGFNPVAIASRNPAPRARSRARTQHPDASTTLSTNCSPTRRSRSSTSPCRRTRSRTSSAARSSSARADFAASSPRSRWRCPSPRPRTCVERCADAGIVAGGQPEHALRPVGAGREGRAQPRLARRSRCWRPSTCGRSRTGCRGPRGCRRCPRSS